MSFPVRSGFPPPRRGGAANDNESLSEQERAPDRSSEREPAYDFFEVPAAVVCAVCGDADCAGCPSSELSRSGIVSIVAWEREGALWSRLWETARLTTKNQGGFFELLPDGPVLPALRFALLSELIASLGLAISFTLVALVVAPEWLIGVLKDPVSRSFALRVVGAGVPALATLLVLAHAIHGWGVDVGARKHGALLGARTRALRFGLYAAGWDLVIGPVGFVVVALKEGFKEALGLGSTLAGLPKNSSFAFLRGAYRLEGDEARKALFSSYVAAGVSTLVLAFMMLVAIVWLTIS